jgi:hypothetical protein
MAASFHPGAEDVQSLIGVLRLLLDGYKTWRSERRQSDKQADKEERALEDALKDAEAKTTGSAIDPQTVVSGIEAKLEEDLGASGKDAIMGRAAGILALSRPFDVESFRFYDLLSNVLVAANTFSAAMNLYRLRGNADDSNGYILHLPRTSAPCQRLLERSGYLLTDASYGDNAVGCRIAEVHTFITTSSELRVMAVVEVKRASTWGEQYDDFPSFGLTLTAGDEVNQIGFHIDNQPQRSFLRDFSVRLTVKELKDLLFAVLSDLADITEELFHEEKRLRDEVTPALAQLMAVLQNRQTRS